MKHYQKEKRLACTGTENLAMVRAMVRALEFYTVVWYGKNLHQFLAFWHFWQTSSVKQEWLKWVGVYFFHKLEHKQISCILKLFFLSFRIESHHHCHYDLDIIKKASFFLVAHLFLPSSYE